MIQTEDLSKQFGDFWAVDGITLAVQPGQVLALLGQNGAGKTTTIRTLLGLITTDGGEISFFGKKYDTYSDGFDPVRRDIGVCLDSPGFYPDLSAAARFR